jgi:hypothetical protein
LLVHTQQVNCLAGVATETTLSGIDLGRSRIELVAYAGTALLVLLSVYKPRGMTRYGLR